MRLTINVPSVCQSLGEIIRTLNDSRKVDGREHAALNDGPTIDDDITRREGTAQQQGGNRIPVPCGLNALYVPNGDIGAFARRKHPAFGTTQGLRATYSGDLKCLAGAHGIGAILNTLQEKGLAGFVQKVTGVI